MYTDGLGCASRARAAAIPGWDCRIGQAIGLRAQLYAVDVAADGREGQHYINSYERRVRQSNPSLTVLVPAARDAVEEEVRHFKAGADDYLTKPFDFATSC